MPKPPVRSVRYRAGTNGASQMAFNPVGIGKAANGFWCAEPGASVVCLLESAKIKKRKVIEPTHDVVRWYRGLARVR
jgi:hypothetical protein